MVYSTTITLRSLALLSVVCFGIIICGHPSLASIAHDSVTSALISEGWISPLPPISSPPTRTSVLHVASSRKSRSRADSTVPSSIRVRDSSLEPYWAAYLEHCPIHSSAILVYPLGYSLFHCEQTPDLLLGDSAKLCEQSFTYPTCSALWTDVKIFELDFYLSIKIQSQGCRSTQRIVQVSPSR
jgi:hypothetical protein